MVCVCACLRTFTRSRYHQHFLILVRRLPACHTHAHMRFHATHSLALTLTLTLSRPSSRLRGGWQHAATQCALSLLQLSRRHGHTLLTMDQSKLSMRCSWYCACAGSTRTIMISSVDLFTFLMTRECFSDRLFALDDKFSVVSKGKDGWWEGIFSNGQHRLFPSSHVTEASKKCGHGCCFAGAMPLLWLWSALFIWLRG